jgi:restriction system-associated AAA family ATPase
MKIKKIQLINGYYDDQKRFKSLEPFNQEFVCSTDMDKIEPICLVGINGSGKSNLLELIADIFYYLESFFLEYIPTSSQKKFIVDFAIEYYIKVNGKTNLIKVIRAENKNPEYFIINEETGKEKPITNKKDQKKLLPNRIIGYSSGLNETLSIPFKTSRAFYSDQVGIQANPKSKARLNPKDVYPPRLMYMDNETNAFIVLANFLFKSVEDLKVFNDTLRIKGLHSFRIIIQFNHPAAPKGGIRRTPELDEYVEKLVGCATTWEYISDSATWTMDFYNSVETRKAFEYYFSNAQNLFDAFYKLNLLNPLCVKAMHRKWAILNDIFPSDKAFRVDQLKLEIRDPKEIIDYSGISDGEHQFLHILGTALLFDEENNLYLLDEPETHYNPKWRAEFITHLNLVITKYPQEFVITTHSPFLLSDTRGYNVFVFRRKGDKVWFEPIGFETFGSSFQILLKKAFDRDVLISEMALEEIKELEKEENLGLLIDGASKLGESYEKQFLLEKINKKILEQKSSK